MKKQKQNPAAFSPDRREVLAGGAALASLLAAGWPATALAQAAGDYPNRAIRLLVAVAPGGPTDALARMVGQHLTEAWGQPVVIENRPGAGQVIGTGAAAKATPDGYTLLMTTNTIAVNPWLFNNLPYDTKNDFVPITQVSSSNLVLVTHPSLPVKNLQEFIAYAKANPGKLNFGSSGPSSSLRLAVELLKSMAGLDMVHVPFQGSGPLMTAVLGNVVQLGIMSIPTVKTHIDSGAVRGIAVTSDQRDPSLPDLPTMSEAGLKGYSAQSWFGLVAPRGVPEPIVDKLYKEVAKVLKKPEVVAKLRSQGETPVGSTPAAFAAYIDEELVKWQKVIKDSNIVVQ